MGPWDGWYIFTYMFHHKNQPNVGKYTYIYIKYLYIYIYISYMDPMGICKKVSPVNVLVYFSLISILPSRTH